MARKTALDVEWERIIRALTAWEAVRSSPEYRRDWEANKKFVEWWEKLPSKKKTLPALFGDSDSRTPEVQIWRWLVKLGRKWNFKTQLFLTDPAFSIPFKERKDYAQEKAALDREWPEAQRRIWPYPRFPKLSREAKRAAQWLCQVNKCPYDYVDALGVFLQWPLRAWAESQPELWKKQKRTGEMRFDEKERGRGRIVLWISRNISRKVAEEDIKRQLNCQWEKAEKSGLRDPRQVKTKNALKHLRSEEFLILSVDLRASKRQVKDQLQPLLERFPNLPDFEAHVSRLWQGLEIYRYGDVAPYAKKYLSRRTAEQELEKHRQKREEGGRSSLIKQYQRSMESAKIFIEKKSYRKLIQAHDNSLWQNLSPKEPPRLSS